MKLAALDLGSHSFHLLVAATNGAAELFKVGSHKEVLRLGSVVRLHGQLTSEAFDDALACVGRSSAVARDLGADQLVAVATSALRDARNGRAFVDACWARLGVRVELVTGEEEARLVYQGARSALELTTGRVLVADIGGGSVELAAGESQRCDATQSLPLGFLRLSHAFRMEEPGGALRLARYAERACERARWQLGRSDTLLLSGGTARAIGKVLGGGVASVSACQLLKLCDELSRSSPAQLMERGVERRRAESLAAGAAVTAGLVAGLGQREVRISPRGLREGIILRELSRQATRAA